jgi:hypothetical protein
VHEIVLGMYLEAVAAGERTIERALREIRPALAKLIWWDRSRIGWQFVETALETSVRKLARKPRGRPSAWCRASNEIVDLIHEREGLPIETAANAYDKRTAFHRAAEVWAEWGIEVTPRQVQDAYWPKRKATEATR